MAGRATEELCRDEDVGEGLDTDTDEDLEDEDDDRDEDELPRPKESALRTIKLHKATNRNLFTTGSF